MALTCVRGIVAGKLAKFQPASALVQMHISAFNRQDGMEWGFTHSLVVAFSGLEWG